MPSHKTEYALLVTRGNCVNDFEMLLSGRGEFFSIRQILESDESRLTTKVCDEFHDPTVPGVFKERQMECCVSLGVSEQIMRYCVTHNGLGKLPQLLNIGLWNKANNLPC